MADKTSVVLKLAQSVASARGVLLAGEVTALLQLVAEGLLPQRTTIKPKRVVLESRDPPKFSSVQTSEWVSLLQKWGKRECVCLCLWRGTMEKVSKPFSSGYTLCSFKGNFCSR